MRKKQVENEAANDIFSMSTPEKSETATDIFSVSTPKKTKRKRNVKRILINIAASLMLVFCSLVLVGMMMLNVRPVVEQQEQPNDLDRPAIQVQVEPSTHGDVSYFLVIGHDYSDNLTDIMMVLCFDHGQNKASILQIPRDTFIGSDVATGKVNAVYGSAGEGGDKIGTLMARINTHFGLPIDHYVSINIEGFRYLVDAVGGVTVDLPQKLNVDDSVNKENLMIGPGIVKLDGALAEGFIRHRKSYTEGDVGRMKAQRLFFAAFAEKMLNMSGTQMIRVATTCFDQVKTDLTVGEMLSYVNEAEELELENISIFSVPGQGFDTVPPGLYERLSYYSVYKNYYIDMINENFLPYGPKITAKDIELESLMQWEPDESEMEKDNADFGSILTDEPSGQDEGVAGQ